MTATNRKQVDAIEVLDHINTAEEFLNAISMAAYGIHDNTKMNAICRVAEAARLALEDAKAVLNGAADDAGPHGRR